jgi:exodeoxyribonuclease VII large subunit
VKQHFDVVAIIRGGGGDVGLSCYNNYELAREIAMFPIPVITGIGHATNETVTEMIAFSNAITPTKLAEYLLQTFHNFSVPVQEAEKLLIDKSRRLLSEESTKFKAEVKLFRSVTENILSTNRNNVKSITRSLAQHGNFLFRNQKEYLRSIKVNIIKGANTNFNVAKQDLRNFAIVIRKDSQSQLNQFKGTVFRLTEKLRAQSEMILKESSLGLNNIEKNISNMDPANVLKRGYSITRLNGKSVTSILQVKNGDVIDTTLLDGNVSSIVKSTKKTTDQ